MSDILIKNMKMPKDNYVVMTLYPSGNCYLYYQGCGVIEKTAEVIEVPPHGRLIDADALDICRREQQAWQDYEHNPDNEYLEGVKDGLHEASKQLSTAMTIIEEEE